MDFTFVWTLVNLILVAGGIALVGGILFKLNKALNIWLKKNKE